MIAMLALFSLAGLSPLAEGAVEDDVAAADDIAAAAAAGGVTPYIRLRTWALGGPGGSNITVTILVLSALRFRSFHRSMAKSTSLFEGLTHLKSP